MKQKKLPQYFSTEPMKDFLRSLAMARMAGMKATPKKVDVDKAWKEFSNGSYRNRMKIAASIVGIIFLSGVALAAVQNGWFKFSSSDKVVEEKAATEQTANSKQLANDSLKAITTEPKDSLDMKPVVFDDAELGTVLMAQWKFSGDKHKSLQVYTERTFHQRYLLVML